jgi:hypothetical protein
MSRPAASFPLFLLGVTVAFGALVGVLVLVVLTANTLVAIKHAATVEVAIILAIFINYNTSFL